MKGRIIQLNMIIINFRKCKINLSIINAVYFCVVLNGNNTENHSALSALQQANGLYELLIRT